MVLAHKSSTDEIIELRKAFNEFDTERNGTISLNEFRAGMEKSGNVSNSYTQDQMDEMSTVSITRSKCCTPEGCEVQLCFKYELGNTYSLHVYGPICGGRVSISSAKIRKVSALNKIVRTLHGKQSDVSGGQLQLHHALKELF